MRPDLRNGSLPTRVRNLVKEATNLKTAQFTGWDSIKCYNIQTTNQWDLDVNTNGSTIYVRYAADYQDAPFATLVADVSLDGDSLTYRKSAAGAPPSVSIIEDTSGSTFDRSITRKPNELYWSININTITTAHIQVKIRVFATQPGRITAGTYNASTQDYTFFIS